jgi:uncharacterized membrane protein
MKREQFLRELRDALYLMKPEEREDILRDQDEYIRDAVAAGRNEEQVIDSLGTPRSFAANLLVESKLQKVEDASSLNQKMTGTFSAVLAILALAPLNLIFVLGPYLGLLGCNIAAWTVAVSVIICAMIGLAIWLVKLVFLSVGAATHLASLFFILGWLGIGILSIFLMLWLTRLFIAGTLSYLRWNLTFIRGKRA